MTRNVNSDIRKYFPRVFNASLGTLRIYDGDGEDDAQ